MVKLLKKIAVFVSVFQESDSNLPGVTKALLRNRGLCSDKSQ